MEEESKLISEIYTRAAGIKDVTPRYDPRTGLIKSRTGNVYVPVGIILSFLGYTKQDISMSLASTVFLPATGRSYYVPRDVYNYIKTLESQIGEKH